MDGMYSLLSKCRCIQHLNLKYARFLNDQHVAELSLFLAGLKSINLSSCNHLTESALFSLVRSCPLLSDIKMERTNIGKESAVSSNSLRDFVVVNPQLKSLCLARCEHLKDENIILFASIFPTLELLDLRFSDQISEELSLFSLVKNCPSLSEIKMEDTDIGKENVENNDSMMDIGIYPQLKSLYLGDNLWLSVQKIIMFASSIPSLQLLDLNDCDLSDGIWQFVRRFDMITHLNLASCTDVNKFKMNFVLPKLQVLDLADTGVDDETVYAISKSCPGLLELLLKYCYYVTEKGVKHVVENCKQLRKIEFSDFYVHDTIRELAMDALFASVLKFL
ncbi:F-box/LRR-repeat protein 4 [Medicago truncatula]|uniref:F-box/LRR-repeat protein 4 n=1 Tax=Medicago truncatula TaxID=3880 RepID=UPI000D2F369E|nr:F-box/LRR-repeat protein 4 [Medicago truncatula]